MPPTTSASTASATPISRKAIAALALVALVVLSLDQLVKMLVVENLPLGETIPFIGELLQFRFVKNSGAAFSIGNGSTWIFSIIATAVAIFIVIFAPRIRSWSWAILFGLLLGGNLGNLADRLFREPSFGQGHVIDFLVLYAFPAIFNVADIAIVSSMGLFVILTIRGTRLDGRKRVANDSTDVDSSDQVTPEANGAGPRRDASGTAPDGE